MDCPTTEEAFEERGPLGHLQKAPSLLHGHACAVLAWRQRTRPVHTSVLILHMSPGMAHLLVPLILKSLVGKAEPGASQRWVKGAQTGPQPSLPIRTLAVVTAGGSVNKPE